MTKILPALALAAAFGCATTPSTVERNKATARRAFSEILEKGRYDLVRELYAPDFRNGSYTLEEDMAALKEWHRVMPPGATMRPELVVAEGDYVTVLWVARATAKERDLAFRGITIWNIVDGRIRREWSEFDEDRARRELGLPAAEEVPAESSATGRVRD